MSPQTGPNAGPADGKTMNPNVGDYAKRRRNNHNTDLKESFIMLSEKQQREIESVADDMRRACTVRPEDVKRVFVS
jgi:hypothetical protein